MSSFSSLLILSPLSSASFHPASPRLFSSFVCLPPSRRTILNPRPEPAVTISSKSHIRKKPSTNDRPLNQKKSRADTTTFGDGSEDTTNLSEELVASYLEKGFLAEPCSGFPESFNERYSGLEEEYQTWRHELKEALEHYVVNARLGVRSVIGDEKSASTNTFNLKSPLSSPIKKDGAVLATAEKEDNGCSEMLRILVPRYFDLVHFEKPKLI